MTGSDDDSGWEPSPELLAAYFDGECEARDDLAGVRRRLERWLSESPRGCAELAEYRQLRQLWLQSTPPEPAPQAWQAVHARLEAAFAVPRPTRILANRRTRRWTAFAAMAAAVLVMVGVLTFSTKPAVDDTPFPVASEREVVILRVDGDDTGTLVVGELPLEGPMELVSRGEITLSSAQPAQRDNMLPDIELNGPGRPMIWARSATEED